MDARLLELCERRLLLGSVGTGPLCKHTLDAALAYYGGINYGYGYTGRGYYGAYWNHGRLNHNRAITNVDITIIHNVYNYQEPNNRGDRVSYNGVPGVRNASVG